MTLIGATTENPYFEVNSALLSRAQVYELQRARRRSDVEALLRRALERGAGERSRGPRRGRSTFLAVRSGGDARTALNALELAIATAQRAQERHVTLGDAEDALQRKAVLYDKAGDQHYDYISAWIKSTRGSDPDASLYYLAAMIEGGEDPRFIARRMIVLASEDIGNADPQALADRGRRGATRSSTSASPRRSSRSPRRRSTSRWRRSPTPSSARSARSAAHIREHGAKPPPAPLRSAAYPAARKLGRGDGYDYPHDHPGHVNDQEHLPEGLEDLRFYFPDEGEPEARGAARGDPEGARGRRVACAADGRRAPQPLWALRAARGSRALPAPHRDGDPRRARGPRRRCSPTTVGQPRTEAVLAELLPSVGGLHDLADHGPRALRDRRLGRIPALRAGAARCSSPRRSGRSASAAAAASPWAEPVLETAAALLAGNAVVLSTPLGERVRRGVRARRGAAELIALAAPEEDLGALADHVVDTRPPRRRARCSCSTARRSTARRRRAVGRVRRRRPPPRRGRPPRRRCRPWPSR